MKQPSSLGYFLLEASDLGKWKDFGVNVLGMQVGRYEEGRVLSLRMDEYEHRILINQGPLDDMLAAGWEFPTEEALEEYVAGLEARDVDIRDCGAETAGDRQVRKLYACKDPNGWDHEFYYGPAIAPSQRPFQSALVTGGFEAGPLGAGHFVTVAKDAEETNGFYRDVLGFSVSDYIHLTGVPGIPDTELSFYHVGTGRHHSVAVGEMPGSPKRINHIMVQTKDLADVGLAYDRFVEAGVPIFAGIGQHPNDRMVSFYAQTPSGFGIEYGWGAVVVDDETWTVATYSQPSLWGHKPLPAPTGR